MSSQSPPPQISPDGKFYWDGARWVPMRGQAPTARKPGSMRVVARGTLIRVVGFGAVFFAAYQSAQARQPFAALWLLAAFAILGVMVAWIVMRRGLR
jgi:hypothetical protein